LSRRENSLNRYASQVNGRTKTQKGLPSALSFLRGEVLRNKLPVHQRPEVLQVARTRIAVINVIRMFPYVDSHQRGGVGSQRRTGVGC